MSHHRCGSAALDNPTPHSPPLPNRAVALLEQRAKCRVLKIAYRLARLRTAGRRSPWMTPPSPCAHAPRMVRRDRASRIAHRASHSCSPPRVRTRVAATRIDSPHVTVEIRLSKFAVEAMAELIGVRLEFFAQQSGNQHLRAPALLPRAPALLPDAREQLRRAPAALLDAPGLLLDAPAPLRRAPAVLLDAPAPLRRAPAQAPQVLPAAEVRDGRDAGCPELLLGPNAVRAIAAARDDDAAVTARCVQGLVQVDAFECSHWPVAART